MNTSKKIIDSENLKNFLISREAADSLFNSIKDSKEDIEMDFSNIEFISRSFADQFYKAKEQFEKNSNSKIYVVNANEEIINMLHIVSETQNPKERIFKNVPVFKFSKPELITSYLLSI